MLTRAPFVPMLGMTPTPCMCRQHQQNHGVIWADPGGGWFSLLTKTSFALLQIEKMIQRL